MGNKSDKLKETVYDKYGLPVDFKPINLGLDWHNLEIPKEIVPLFILRQPSTIIILGEISNVLSLTFMTKNHEIAEVQRVNYDTMCEYLNLSKSEYNLIRFIHKYSYGTDADLLYKTFDITGHDHELPISKQHFRKMTAFAVCLMDYETKKRWNCIVETFEILLRKSFLLYNDILFDRFLLHRMAEFL